MRYSTIFLAVIFILSSTLNSCGKKEKPPQKQETSVQISMIGDDKEINLIKETFQFPKGAWIHIIPIIYPDERPGIVEIGFIYYESINNDEHKGFGCPIEFHADFSFADCVLQAMKHFEVEQKRNWTLDEHEEIENIILQSFVTHWILNTTKDSAGAIHKKYGRDMDHQHDKLAHEGWDHMKWEEISRKLGDEYDINVRKIRLAAWEELGEKLERNIPRSTYFNVP
jgi:hypothetical protein